MSHQLENELQNKITEGFKTGNKLGESTGFYMMANQMRVLFCALITAHQKKDDLAFWSTVEIVKANINQHAVFTDKEWDIFR